MKKLSFLPKVALALALTAGALLVPATPAAAGCPFEDMICPAVYDPVICVNGKVYSNGCYAMADCAVGCVPYDPSA